MKIRSRLLLFLLPTLVGFIALISILLDLNRYKEIRAGLEMELKGIVVSCAELLSDSDPSWISNDTTPDAQQQRQQYRQALIELQQDLQLKRLYIITMDGGASGEGWIVAPSADLPQEALIAPFYLMRTKDKSLFTAFAPIKNGADKTVALLAADKEASIIEQEMQESLLIILAAAGFTIVLVTICALLIAHHISRPIEQLKNSALAIAAGQYDIDIHIKGPQEITDLANTLNTMSECLEENMTHLRESSLVRERMYGEYECGLLLQYNMLQKVIENFHHPRLSLRAISLASNNLYGLLCKMKSNDENSIGIHLLESKEKGFDPLYEMLMTQNDADSKSISLQIDLKLQEEHSSLSFRTQGFPEPIVWSTMQRSFAEKGAQGYLLEKGDLFFLYNQGLARLMPDMHVLHSWFSKVLRHFAAEGLSPSSTMLDKELRFLTRKRHIEHDIHLLCFVVN